MKYKIGQLVAAPDGEVGKIVSVRITENGIFYAIESKEVDLQAKEIINGVKHLEEDEIKPVKKGTNE